MQIGNFSSAYFTNAIAVHTFNSLVIRRRQSVIVCRSTIAIGWVWAGLMGKLYSCIATKDLMKSQLALHSWSMHPTEMFTALMDLPVEFVQFIPSCSSFSTCCPWVLVALYFSHSNPQSSQILIASTLGTVLYSLIFLVLRGTLKIRSGIKLTLNPNERWTNSEDLEVNYHRFIARIAKSMLW